ncbi:hypothetical protein ACR9PT_08890 [Piscirickettsia salmonis]|uniref:hypothetical protein n=1 Tax=Piscirickettsia salmonis TaxID=1238 RepID=UPI003EBA08B0
MDNQAPHIRDVLNSLQQITGEPWREVRDKATVCLAFNTDLTDHTVLPTEKSMWPTSTKYVAPVAHDQDGSHDSWWDKTKNLWNLVEKGASDSLDYVEKNHAKILETTGIILFAMTPEGWFFEGAALVGRGVTMLADSRLMLESAQLGESLGSESNLFYTVGRWINEGGSKVIKGSAMVATRVGSPVLVWAGNWEQSSGKTFQEHVQTTAANTLTDMGYAISFGKMGFGGLEMSKARAVDSVIKSAHKISKGIAGIATIHGGVSVLQAIKGH